MKNLVIAHLYYDLLNLYGESGNISVLKHHLNSLSIESTIQKLSINDDLDFSEYDLVYIGCGTMQALNIASNHLIMYKEQLNDYIESNGFVLATGNAMSLFGNYSSIKSLNIFDYEVIETKRFAAESVLESDILQSKLISFKNTSLEFNIDNSVFTNNEGYNYNNFYGMNILGPVLYRNPEFLNYFINELTGSKQTLNLKLNKLAFNNYMNWKY